MPFGTSPRLCVPSLSLLQVAWVCGARSSPTTPPTEHSSCGVFGCAHDRLTGRSVARSGVASAKGNVKRRSRRTPASAHALPAPLNSTQLHPPPISPIHANTHVHSPPPHPLTARGTIYDASGFSTALRLSQTGHTSPALIGNLFSPRSSLLMRMLSACTET